MIYYEKAGFVFQITTESFHKKPLQIIFYDTLPYEVY
jgi:hypothetical protein